MYVFRGSSNTKFPPLMYPLSCMCVHVHTHSRSIIHNVDRDLDLPSSFHFVLFRFAYAILDKVLYVRHIHTFNPPSLPFPLSFLIAPPNSRLAPRTHQKRGRESFFLKNKSCLQFKLCPLSLPGIFRKNMYTYIICTRNLGSSQRVLVLGSGKGGIREQGGVIKTQVQWGTGMIGRSDCRCHNPYSREDEDVSAVNISAKRIKQCFGASGFLGVRRNPSGRSLGQSLIQDVERI